MKRLLPMFLLCLSAAAAGFGFRQTRDFTLDRFESYADGAILNALNGGRRFSGAFVDNGPGIVGLDDAESYSDGATLNALNGGNGFATAYTDRERFTGIDALDDQESYADGASVNGLNGGSVWGGAYVDR